MRGVSVSVRAGFGERWFHIGSVPTGLGAFGVDPRLVGEHGFVGFAW